MKKEIAHREVIPVVTLNCKTGKSKKSSFTMEYTAEEWEKQQATRKAMKKVWCQCKDEGETRFFDDGECNCGVHKHHWHCENCGKITQIG